MIDKKLFWKKKKSFAIGLFIIFLLLSSKHKKKGCSQVVRRIPVDEAACIRKEEIVEVVENKEEEMFASKTWAAVAAVWCSRAGTGVEALGCQGGDTFHGGGDGCNLNSVTCTQEACEDEMGGVWTEECESSLCDLS